MKKSLNLIRKVILSIKNVNPIQSEKNYLINLGKWIG